MEQDNFYIFDVGQGNCQLVIYGEKNIGFLYDCGSTKTKIHVSLKNIVWKTIFKDGQSSTGLQNTTQSLSLKEILSGLEFCFVFLSHADEDHISLVNKKNFPEELHAFFFLGGDFLSKGTGVVTNLLKFFQQRTQELTWVELPYYWSDDDTYIHFKENFLNSINEKEQYGLKNVKLKEDNFFQGSFYELLEKVQTINSESPTFQNGIETLLKKNTNSKQVFEEHVYIYAMNQKSNDSKNYNVQSTVMSFILPNNNIQLICTGDAENKTFELIKNRMENTVKTQEILSKCKNMEKILIIPHHGSHDRRDPINHDNINNLFKPTVFIISAGSDKQYGHPRQETYNKLNEIKKEDNPSNITFYHDKAIPSSEGKRLTIIVYSKEKLGTNKYYIENKIPVLGTNAMGTIYLHSTVENINIKELRPLLMKEIQDQILKMFSDSKLSPNVCNEEKSTLETTSQKQTLNINELESPIIKEIRDELQTFLNKLKPSLPKTSKNICNKEKSSKLNEVKDEGEMNNDDDKGKCSYDENKGKSNDEVVTIVQAEDEGNNNDENIKKIGGLAKCFRVLCNSLFPCCCEHSGE
jgi:hypothetical protein